MKKLYTFLSILIVLVCFSQRSLAQSVTYQFYHDINNNCNMDAGEPLLYNLPGYLTLQYVNLSSNTVAAYGFSLMCNPPISVSNPSVPAANTLSYTPTGLNSISVNTTCSSFTNLSYTGTNNIPIKSISQMSDPVFYSNTAGVYTINATNSVVPFCNNIADDSLTMNFSVNNIYGCPTASLVTASRTYSLYVDNILIDQAVTTGTMGSQNVVGPMGKLDVSEYYYLSGVSYSIRTKLSGLTVGNHLFELKSTPLYTSTLSAINFSMTLNVLPCNVISGSMYEDCDLNCIKTASDGSLYWGAAAILFNSTNTYSLYPDVTGNFSFIVPTSMSQYSITSLPVSPLFTACPAATATTAVVSTSGYNFGYKAGNYVDPFVYGPRVPGTTNPGSIRNVYITCYNYVTTYSVSCATSFAANSGKIKALLDKNFTYLNPVGTTPAPNSIVPGPNGDTLIWNVANLNLVSSIVYTISAQMASTVTIGTGYTNYSWVYPTTDINFANNLSVFTWSVGLPCDPNDKRSWATGIQPNGDIPLATTDLFYTINFQNVGTAPAINVKCADTLDANLDWNTLQVISSSFPVQVQTDNVTGATFFNFNGINLPDSTSNEPGSHGYVHYRIKLKPSVPVNTVIKNRAHNYFDFQPAVPTNQTKNKLVSITGVNEIERSASVFVAPNPVTDKVNVSSKEMIQAISVFNNLGQIVLKQDVNNLHSQMDLSPMTDGVYFISIQFKDGSKTIRKVVKN